MKMYFKPILLADGSGWEGDSSGQNGEGDEFEDRSFSPSLDRSIAVNLEENVASEVAEDILGTEEAVSFEPIPTVEELIIPESIPLE